MPQSVSNCSRCLYRSTLSLTNVLFPHEEYPSQSGGQSSHTLFELLLSRISIKVAISLYRVRKADKYARSAHRWIKYLNRDIIPFHFPPVNGKADDLHPFSTRQLFVIQKTRHPLFAADTEFYDPIMRLIFWRKWRRSTFSLSKDQAIMRLFCTA